MPELINLSELAKRMGVARKTVEAAENSGRIKVDRTSGKPIVSWPQVRDDWENNKKIAKAPTTDDYQRARAIREKANAEKAILEVAEKKKSLVKMQVVEWQGYEIGRRIREAFEQLPSRISATIAAKTDPHEVEIFLKKEIQQTLEVLADLKGYDGISSGDNSGP